MSRYFSVRKPLSITNTALLERWRNGVKKSAGYALELTPAVRSLLRIRRPTARLAQSRKLWFSLPGPVLYRQDHASFGCWFCLGRQFANWIPGHVARDGQWNGSTPVLHNHALLCLDEIGEVRDAELGEIIYALGNGAGKSRMTRSITSRANTAIRN